MLEILYDVLSNRPQKGLCKWRPQSQNIYNKIYLKMFSRTAKQRCLKFDLKRFLAVVTKFVQMVAAGSKIAFGFEQYKYSRTSMV